jgi:hypothetical protein
LQAPLYTNAAGVLSNPGRVRSNPQRAKAALATALDAMDSLGDWPREQHYE